jgi:hypothetical protein
MAPVAAFGESHAGADPTAHIGESVVDRIPLPLNETTPGAMDFGPGAGIPEADLTGVASLPKETQFPYELATRGDQKGFLPGDSSPYLLGTGEPTGAPSATGTALELPPAVQKAVDRMDEAIGEFNRGQQITEAERINALTERARKLADVNSALSENDALNKSPAAGVALSARLAGQQTRGAELTGIPQDVLGAPPPVVEQTAPITDAPIGNLIGKQVEYYGTQGILARDRKGNFMVLPPVRENSKPFWVEIADTGKDPSTLASTVGVKPLEPANMTPNPAPAVTVPGAPATGQPREASKVPLGELFPSDIVPRQDLRGDVQGVTGGLLPPQQGNPQPIIPNAAAPFESPVAQVQGNPEVTTAVQAVAGGVPGEIQPAPGAVAPEVATPVVIPPPSAGVAPAVAPEASAAKTFSVKRIDFATAEIIEEDISHSEAPKVAKESERAVNRYEALLKCLTK